MAEYLVTMVGDVRNLTAHGGEIRVFGRELYL